MNSDDVEVRTERTAATTQAHGSRAGRAYRGQRRPASTVAGAALLGGASAFGAIGLSLALLGLGVPFLIACLAASCAAGLLIYAAGRWSAARAAAEPAAKLPHELRGALLPAMMVSDRLLNSDDPAIRRAGDAVLRSVERAVALITPEQTAEDGVIPGAAGTPHPGERAPTSAGQTRT